MRVAALRTVVPEHAIRFFGHDTHAHDEPHLVYVVTGTAHMVVDDEPVVLRAEEAVWLAPRVPHALRFADQDGMALGPMLADDIVPTGRRRLLGRLPALVTVMTTVLVAAPSTEDQIAPFRTAVGDILRRVGREYFPVTLPIHDVARAIAEESVLGTSTLGELAGRHFMSERQVQRLFVEETGMPFARWRSRARLNAAAAHILGGGRIATATRLSGYATRAGLLRALSRETGAPVAELAADPAAALAERRDA
ncbi:AraC family transcriptional regulator [Phytomonospora sp. NPDC050363]|uniref:helix-turn-helix domain-containing protein n=1 Tax=Phytomonospora sp. NPDC050363 TaxID=3155642 RepID=UPI00340EEE30